MTDRISDERLAEITKQQFMNALDMDFWCEQPHQDGDVLKALRELQERRKGDAQAIEYQQVAALVCARIDLMLTVAKMPNTTAVEVMENLKEFKDTMIADADARRSCYNANCIMYDLMMRQPPKDTP
jgi:Mg2+/Co2+ transporter CorC